MNIALANQSLSTCPSFDCDGTGEVGINCLVEGVNNALNGCDSMLRLGSASVAPFESITILGGTFQPDERLHVRFFDANGYSITVPVDAVIPLQVVVPFFIDMHTGTVDAGTVSVEVLQSDGSSLPIAGLLRVAALPVVESVPGALAFHVVRGSQNALSAATLEMTRLQQAIHTNGLNATVTGLQTAYGDLATLRAAVVGAADGDGAAKLGTIQTASGPVSLNLDRDSLAEADRITAALLKQLPASANGVAARVHGVPFATLAAADTDEFDDAETFAQIPAQLSQDALEIGRKVGSAANIVVGVLALAGAAGAITVSAPQLALLGAVGFTVSTWVPAAFSTSLTIASRTALDQQLTPSDLQPQLRYIATRYLDEIGPAIDGLKAEGFAEEGAGGVAKAAFDLVNEWTEIIPSPSTVAQTLLNPGQGAVMPGHCGPCAVNQVICDIDVGSSTPYSCCCASCSDGNCSSTESPSSCPTDCGAPQCGNGSCEAGENTAGCPTDCPGSCGDGFCAGLENAANCNVDCAQSAAVCGDGVCASGEDCLQCASDCGACPRCGNGACEPGEDAATCPQDCGNCEVASLKLGSALRHPASVSQLAGIPCVVPVCGNSACESQETAENCPEDCGAALCGDGVCSGAAESCDTCPSDCGGCSGCACPDGSACPNNDAGQCCSANSCVSDCADNCGNYNSGCCTCTPTSCGSDCADNCGNYDSNCCTSCTPSSCGSDCADNCGNYDSNCCTTCTPTSCGSDCADNCGNYNSSCCSSCTPTSCAGSCEDNCGNYDSNCCGCTPSQCVSDCADNCGNYNESCCG